ARPMITTAGVFMALAAVPAGAGRPIEVRANAAFSACLAPALAAFNRTSATRAVLTTAEPDPPGSAALVVGDDLEMTRLLEGGTAEVSSAADLGSLPWVAVVPQGSGTGTLSALAAGEVSVLGGRAGREARAALGGFPGRLRVTRNAEDLRAAAYALVPRSLAGAGEHRPASVRPLVATAAVVTGHAQAASARALLEFLRSAEGRRLLNGCLDPVPVAASGRPAADAEFASAVVDWWLPQCSLDRNRYSDPQTVLGGPDAANLGGRDNYRGMMSLGQGGYVVVDMGAPVMDGAGADIRVYQATTGEPVTLYAATSAAGPFVLLGLRVACGTRTPGLFSNHCDFDLAEGGLAEARYLKIEDGEIYPCRAAGTLSEGPDVDAVELLAP
ncbi:MAG TPA: hypothetical protein VFO85_02945, partial [Vicinamibacteria bacterium]|nr:hypothetical protein [Vicinamibacteria bacterium]